MDIKYNIFLISDESKPNMNVPRNVFLERGINAAKEWFEGWLFDSKDPSRYKLYKIGEIDLKKNLNTIKPIFICDGFQIIYGNENKYNAYKQKKLNLVDNFVEIANETNIETIERLFKGKRIENE